MESSWILKTGIKVLKMKIMIFSVSTLLFFSLSASASLFLQHNTTSTCPGGVVSCECSGATLVLRWEVEIDGQRGRITYDSDSEVGPASRMSLTTTNGMVVASEAVLLSLDSSTTTLPVLSSLLYVTVGSQDVSVTCSSNDGTRTATLHALGEFTG